MGRRYQLFADAGTKNIGTYNGWVKRVLSGEIKNPLGKAIVGRDHNNLQEVLSVRFDDPEAEQIMPEVLPMIVIVVDASFTYAPLGSGTAAGVPSCPWRLGC